MSIMPLDGLGIRVQWLCPNRERYRWSMDSGNWWIGWRFACRSDAATWNPTAMIRILGLRIDVGLAFSDWRRYTEGEK